MRYTNPRTHSLTHSRLADNTSTQTAHAFAPIIVIVVIFVPFKPTITKPTDGAKNRKKDFNTGG